MKIVNPMFKLRISPVNQSYATLSGFALHTDRKAMSFVFDWSASLSRAAYADNAVSPAKSDILKCGWKGRLTEKCWILYSSMILQARICEVITAKQSRNKFGTDFHPEACLICFRGRIQLSWTRSFRHIQTSFRVLQMDRTNFSFAFYIPNWVHNIVSNPYQRIIGFKMRDNWSNEKFCAEISEFDQPISLLEKRGKQGGFNSKVKIPQTKSAPAAGWKTVYIVFIVVVYWF